MSRNIYKIQFDETLGQQLKEFRNKYSVKAKDISEYIGKSAAYISKLEKGDIKQIPKRELVSVLNFITKKDDGYQLFVEEICGKVDLERLNSSVIISNFDWIERNLPIPDKYIDYVLKKFDQLELNSDVLAEYINQNEDLGEEFFSEHKINVSDVVKNVWYSYYEADSQRIERNYIIVDIEGDQIDGIINKRIKNSNYLFLYSILYHINKYEARLSRPYLDVEYKSKIAEETRKQLMQFKIYTFIEKYKVMKNAANSYEAERFLSAYDLNNKSIINDLNSELFYLSNKDIEYVNEKLSGILKNLKSMDSFALAFMALDFSNLSEMSTKLKHEFLNSVMEIIKKYGALQDDSFEKY